MKIFQNYINHSDSMIDIIFAIDSNYILNIITINSYLNIEYQIIFILYF